MMDALTKMQRQLLALAILLMIAGIVFMFTAAPLMSLNTHYRDTIERLDQRLQILQRKVATGDELRSRQKQLKQILAINRHYLKSNTESLAAADLQRIVKQVSRSHNTEVLSTQIMPAIKELGFSGVTLKVRIRGTLNNAVKIFHSLETGKPYLFIDDLSIRSRAQNSRSIQYGNNRNAQSSNPVQTLDVDFEVTGYMPQQS